MDDVLTELPHVVRSNFQLLFLRLGLDIGVMLHNERDNMPQWVNNYRLFGVSLKGCGFDFLGRGPVSHVVGDLVILGTNLTAEQNLMDGRLFCRIRL